MKGIIQNKEYKKTVDGKPYAVIKINDEYVTDWDDVSKMFNVEDEVVIEYRETQSNKSDKVFKNLTSIRLFAGVKTQDKTTSGLPQAVQDSPVQKNNALEWTEVEGEMTNCLLVAARALNKARKDLNKEGIMYLDKVNAETVQKISTSLFISRKRR